MEDMEAKKRKMEMEAMEAKKRKMEMEEAREDSEIEWEDCDMEPKKGKVEGGSIVSSDPPPQVARICIHCSQGGLRSYLQKDEFEGSSERACTLCSNPFRVLSWKKPHGNDMYAQVCYKCGSDSSKCQFCASVYPLENLRLCCDQPRPLQPLHKRRMPFLNSSLPQPYDFNVKFGLEKTSGSRLCNTCSGEATNSYSRVDIHYKQCMTCAKPFLIRYWRPPRRKGSPDNSKKAVLCYACSLQHNTCQFCASPTEPGKLMHYPSAQLGLRPRFSFTMKTSVQEDDYSSGSGFRCRKMIIPGR